MKELLLFISVLCLFSCNNNETDFEKYLNSLDNINLPFKYNSTVDFMVKERSENFNQNLYKKYKQFWAERPVGIIYNNEKYVVIPEIVIADYGETPYLMVYNYKGEKLDSLSVFKKSAMDMLYEGFEYVTINNEMKIVVIDSVFTWKESIEGDDREPNSKALSTGKVSYILSSSGKFVNEN